MSYVVITYPKVIQEDLDWIQSIRQEFDLKQFHIVAPHVTLVFPTQQLDKQALINHVQSKLSGINIFTIKFDSAKVVEDDSKTYYHAFLIPSLGFEEINKLHDLLYTDALASELREDIPFIPHLGIGNNPQKQVMDDLVHRINSSGKSVEGKIDEITISEFDGHKVADIMQIALS
jgi:hypothetical protein